MKLKDSELKAILAEVQADLDKSLDLEVKKLSKAAGEDEMPVEEPEMSAPPAEETPGETHSPAEETPGEEQSAPAPEASAPMADEKSPAAPEAPADEAAPADPAAEGEGAMGPEELEAEYSKLDLDTLKMHYLAAKAALFAAMGGAGGAPEASAPAAPPAPPAAPPAGPEASAPAMKSERVEASLSKAEKAELDSLREQVKLQERLFDLLNAPARKAVTAVDFVAKSEETTEKRVLSKSEVAAKLKTVTADSKLAKSDRELVNGYVLGTVSIDKIEHLLK